MKILFLNTSLKGGAAIAASRIAYSIELHGHHVVYYTLNNVVESNSRPVSRLMIAFKVFIIKLCSRGIQFLSKSSYVSFMWWGCLKAEDINNSDFDIVHLHWVNSGLLSLTEFSKIKKPIIWTVHDMWITTGYRHVLLGDGLNFLERLLLPSRRHLLQSMDSLNLVSPSFWLSNRIKETLGIEAKVIPNPVSDAVVSCSAERCVQENNKVLFLHNSREFHKGFDLLERALQIVANHQNVELVTIIDKPIEGRDFKVTKVKYLDKESDVLALIRSVKLVAVPSRVDNYPNVCLEAIRCKIPVVGFDIGGVGEIVEHNATGYIAEPFSVEDFAKGIKLLLDDKIELKFPEEINNPNQIGRMYVELYESCKHA